MAHSFDYRTGPDVEVPITLKPAHIIIHPRHEALRIVQTCNKGRAGVPGMWCPLRVRRILWLLCRIYHRTEGAKGMNLGGLGTGPARISFEKMSSVVVSQNSSLSLFQILASVGSCMWMRQGFGHMARRLSRVTTPP